MHLIASTNQLESGDVVSAVYLVITENEEVLPGGRYLNLTTWTVCAVTNPLSGNQRTLRRPGRASGSCCTSRTGRTSNTSSSWGTGSTRRGDGKGELNWIRRIPRPVRPVDSDVEETVA